MWDCHQNLYQKWMQRSVLRDLSFQFHLLNQTLLTPSYHFQHQCLVRVDTTVVCIQNRNDIFCSVPSRSGGSHVRWFLSVDYKVIGPNKLSHLRHVINGERGRGCKMVNNYWNKTRSKQHWTIYVIQKHSKQPDFLLLSKPRVTPVSQVCFDSHGP